MILEFIVGLVVGYAITPLIRLHKVLQASKMYERASNDSDHEFIEE